MSPLDRLLSEAGHAKGLAISLRDAGVLDEDETLLTDTLEGETNALEAVSGVLRWLAEQEALAGACKVQEGDLAARRRRFEARETAARRALADLMDGVGLTKLERPEATLSLRAGGASVAYAGDFDAAHLPPELTRTKVEADRPAVKAALLAGDDVPGARLSNGPPVLTVRRA